MARYVGIRHRVKMTATGESSPTQVVIRQDNQVIVRIIETEEDELEFVLKEVQKGDVFAMLLGGSGDYLAYALSRQAEKVGAIVLRIPPFEFANRRENGVKDADAVFLSELVQNSPHLFYAVTNRDRDLISVREALFARQDAMKARMACEQRIRSRVIGQVFCRPDGLYPEGGIEKMYDAAKANDVILAALVKEEARRNSDLAKAVERLDVYQTIFKPIEGVGPRIAASIIGGVIDIRRFANDAKFKAYCGVHVLPDGRFARKRAGAVANWNADIRQALVLVAQQFQYRPGSFWGVYLRQMKAKLRAKHPEPVTIDGKRRYTDSHINKMAEWRTLTRFVERLHREWWKLELSHARSDESEQEAA